MQSRGEAPQILDVLPALRPPEAPDPLLSRSRTPQALPALLAWAARALQAPLRACPAQYVASLPTALGGQEGHRRAPKL